jgi:hypothetical protein
LLIHPPLAADLEPERDQLLIQDKDDEQLMLIAVRVSYRSLPVTELLSLPKQQEFMRAQGFPSLGCNGGHCHSDRQLHLLPHAHRPAPVSAPVRRR